MVCGKFLKDNMEIPLKEIDSVDEIGTLNNKSVKMLRLIGGFHLAIGTLKGQRKESVIAAGSHPAIVKYNLEKQFKDFHPIMLKSEIAIDNSIVVKHTHFLSEDLVKSGHDIYSIQKNNNIEFQITKHDVKVASLNGHQEHGIITLSNMNVSKELSNAMASATAEKALTCGASKVKIG